MDNDTEPYRFSCDTFTAHVGIVLKCKIVAKVYSPRESATVISTDAIVAARTLGMMMSNKVLNQPPPNVFEASTKVRSGIEFSDESKDRKTKGNAISTLKKLSS
jgi:hypothetical protein